MTRTGPRRSVRIVLGFVLAAGVVCQFVQKTDSAPPLVYFTVDSAALTALLAFATAPRLGRTAETLISRDVWGAATTGVVLSGVVYATVIAPSTPSHTWFQPLDDDWVRVATVLMHGVGPLLVLADHALSPGSWRRPWRSATRWLLWPLAYLGVVLIAHASGGPPVPYDFLQPAQVPGGWPVVILNGLVAGLIFVFIARGLMAVSARRWRPQEPVSSA